MSKVDETTSCPLDLAHLVEQTFGNADLEAEVLRLFLKQAPDCLERLKAGPDAGTAHLLLGSARGIGATKVASAAAALEVSLLRGQTGDADLSELECNLEAATAFIVARLDAGG